MEHTTSITIQETSLILFSLTLDEFDLTVPVPTKAFDDENSDEAQFTGARLLISGVHVVQDPFLRYKVLQVDRDAGCFAMWEGHTVDASQRRLAVFAEHISMTLETGGFEDGGQDEEDENTEGVWRCVEIKEPRVEIAMLTMDGKPMVKIPPPGGTVRLALACKEYISNTSRIQLLFVLQMYSYLGRVSQALVKVSKGKEDVDPTKGLDSAVAKKPPTTVALAEIASLAPGDSAVSIQVDALRYLLLESIPGRAGVEGPVLAQFLGGGISLRVTFRSLGGAAAITSQVTWQDISVDCVETETLEGTSIESKPSRLNSIGEEVSPEAGGKDEEDVGHPTSGNVKHNLMRPIFWKGDKQGSMMGTGGTSNQRRGIPFMDINIVNVIPYDNDGCHTLRVLAKVGGVRLGGGMGYNEALMRRLGALEEDGSPGKELLKMVTLIRENGTMASLLGTDEMTAASVSYKNEAATSEAAGSTSSADGADANEGATGTWDKAVPDEMDVDVQFLDWLFAIEGAEGVATAREREERCWHSTFRSLRLSTGTVPAGTVSSSQQKNGVPPIQSITVRMEGIQALKPRITDTPPASSLRPPASAGNGPEPSGAQGANASPGTSFPSFPALPDKFVPYAFQRSRSSPNNDSVQAAANAAVGNVGPARTVSTGGAVPPASGSEAAVGRTRGGLDVELRLVNRAFIEAGEGGETGREGGDVKEEGAADGKEENDAEWEVKNIMVAVQEPVEVEVTKAEMSHLMELCKSEMGAASRIAAAALKMLQEQGSPIITQATIDQLLSVGARAVTGGKLDLVSRKTQEEDEVRHREMAAQVSAAQETCKAVQQLLGAQGGATNSNNNEEGEETSEGQIEDGEASAKASEAGEKLAELLRQLEALQIALASSSGTSSD
eukprot:TRINITY_DN5413_c0_g1_i1.p1 TRINITY_DN5413_c0_g1~~TRINITY_DN5413_c0_g1_i1.p1  ORF type:complete len:1047 (+),score=233.14 TRINITY_DN5413_c0_g1_i1:459-3143(+)